MNEDLISQDSEEDSRKEGEYPEYMKEAFKTSESFNDSIEDFQIFGIPDVIQMPSSFFQMFKLITLKTALLFQIKKKNHKMEKMIITNIKNFYYKKF